MILKRLWNGQVIRQLPPAGERVLRPLKHLHFAPSWQAGILGNVLEICAREP